MRITDRIDTAVHSAGTQATTLYLGRREWRELRDYAQVVCCFFVAAPHTKYHRCTYKGRKIFLVDAEEHLGVA